MPPNRPIRKVGIVVNKTIDRALATLWKLIRFLQAKEIAIYLEEGSIDALNAVAKINRSFLPKEVSLEGFCVDAKIDALIALGGDGTVLRASRHAHNVPVLPMNAGRRGFLSEIEAEDFVEDLNPVLEGSYFIETHSRLQAQTEGSSSLPSILNEYLITPSEPLRATSFDLHLGGEERIGRFDADGIIVSTPIGSSGHALSSGGPLIHHNLQVMQISWICPISRSARPIVFPNTLTVSINTISPASPRIKVICDGQMFEVFDSPLQLTVSRSSEESKFIRLRPFFHRKKTIAFLR